MITHELILQLGKKFLLYIGYGKGYLNEIEGHRDHVMQNEKHTHIFD